MSAAYRILSLVEMCRGGHNEGRSDNGVSEATQLAVGWLNGNPGRWFIVGEIPARNQPTIGLDVRTMKRNGLEAYVVNNKVYARLADADGLPLSDFVTKMRPTSYNSPLPMLETDPFNWTIAELSDACVTAYEWLRGRQLHEAA